MYTNLLSNIRRRIMLMLGRAVVNLVNDTTKMQEMQITLLSGEVRDDVERVQDYGFTSVPMSGAEALSGFIGGDQSHGVVIRVDDRRYRLRGLLGGEVAMYTDEGDTITLKRGRKIKVSSGSTAIPGGITIEAKGVTGDVKVIADDAKIIANSITLGSSALSGAATGVVTQQCLCAFTGLPHPFSSQTVKASL